jgi:hypothetical protein
MKRYHHLVGNLLHFTALLSQDFFNNSFPFYFYFLFFIFAGDYAVKAVGVIPDPETFIFELESVDRFMILGSFFVYLDTETLLGIFTVDIPCCDSH